LQAGIDNKFIRVNEKNYSQGDNFYVLEPAKFLTYLSGWKCDVKKENPECKDSGVGIIGSPLHETKKRRK